MRGALWLTTGWDRLAGPHVRLVLNDAPMPLTACAKGAAKKFGACALEDFVAANAFSTAISWGDASWNATCGNPGF